MKRLVQLERQETSLSVRLADGLMMHCKAHARALSSARLPQCAGIPRKKKPPPRPLHVSKGCGGDCLAA